MREAVVRIFMHQPFQPFTLRLSDGRTLDVRHPEQATFGVRAETIVYYHDDRSMEWINPDLVVSFRTIGPTDMTAYDPAGHAPPDEFDGDDD